MLQQNDVFIFSKHVIVSIKYVHTVVKTRQIDINYCLNGQILRRILSKTWAEQTKSQPQRSAQRNKKKAVQMLRQEFKLKCMQIEN